MTYQEFINYYCSYSISLREYYNANLPTANVEKIIVPTEKAFQILWNDYLDLFARVFYEENFHQYSFMPEDRDWFNAIIRTYAPWHNLTEQPKYLQFDFYKTGTNTIPIISTRKINLNDLEDLYNYLTSNDFIIHMQFYNQIKFYDCQAEYID